MDTLKDFGHEFMERWNVASDSLTSNEAILFSLLLIALAAAFTPQIWRITNYYVTVVHEAGHALAGLLVGSRIKGIKIRSDYSGETIQTSGKFLPFRIWTTWWGYPFPAVLGGLYILGATSGRQGIAVTLTLIMLLVMFLNIRSIVAFLSITTALIATAAGWWFLPPETLALILYPLGWFLIFGGINGLANLMSHHVRGTTENSDATSLQQMTFLIPSMAWIASFWIATLFALYVSVKSFISFI